MDRNKPSLHPGFSFYNFVEMGKTLNHDKMMTTIECKVYVNYHRMCIKKNECLTGVRHS